MTKKFKTPLSQTVTFKTAFSWAENGIYVHDFKEEETLAVPEACYQAALKAKALKVERKKVAKSPKSDG